MPELPSWAVEMRDLFRSGSVAQFVLHGNVFDLVPAQDDRLLPLKSFLDEVMFATYDVILHYDRGRGIRLTKGADDFGQWLEETAGADDARKLAMLREPGKVLDLIDRYLLRTLNLRAIGGPGRKIAVVIDFAEFVVPAGQAIQLGGDFASNIVKLLGWANDPAILQANIATVLISENLHDLNELIIENPHNAKLKLALPGEAEMLDYLRTLQKGPLADLDQRSEVSVETLARRLTGLSRIGARTVISLALRNDRRLTQQWLTRMKKEMIERETAGLLEFLESPFNLDMVAGSDAVKQWLREDTRLLREGKLHALPMGYLIAGRIGTGKTFIVNCWAGELGIPCVVFKNFRDRWVGATESNLEKIFTILRALGQVVVFVDEADQMTGKREGGDNDSGLSGRVYAMLASEMSDTRNRGRIIWVFATSRPDLLEVDLKRQGRLDVHIPLFAPQSSAEMHALLLAIARKMKLPLQESDLPELPPGLQLGGNEIEGILVRALRTYELAVEPRPALRELLQQTFNEVRPSAHTRKLEYMDLIAVKECTDARFLPEAYRAIPPEEIDARIDALRRYV
jgi:SpoVK/Ycf46/Vps4 family AAA+-type ATPase